MNEPRLELDALRDAWQGSPAEGTDAVDLSRIRHEVEAQTRRLYLAVAAETAGALLGAVFFLWLAASTSGPGAVAYGVLGVATLIGQAWALRLRRDLWRARAATPAEYLRLQLRRSEVRARLAASSMVAGPAGVAIGILLQQLAPSAAVTRLFERGGTPGIALVLATFVALLFHGWRTLGRERAARRRLERLLGELEG